MRKQESASNRVEMETLLCMEGAVLPNLELAQHSGSAWVSNSAQPENITFRIPRSEATEMAILVRLVSGAADTKMAVQLIPDQSFAGQGRGRERENAPRSSYL